MPFLIAAAWVRHLQSSLGGLVLLLALALMPGVGSAAETTKEYLIKAAFIFNFAQFVEWPSTAFADADSPIRIGVFGSDPFGGALDEAVAGETVRNRRLVVEHVQHIEDLRGCHIAFVGGSEQGRTREVLDALGDAPVLTISDNPDFTASGGVIRFHLDGAKVRFEINPEAAEQRGLKLSAQLLTLAKLVPRPTQ